MTATKGDRRRMALLRSLQEHLEQSTFDSINIADISRRAGVTRSAFYFYFDGKAEAVAALMEEVYDDAAQVGAELFTSSQRPRERVRAFVDGLLATAERHAPIYRAMLEARGSSDAVRELWDADRGSFVEPVAALIEEEREAGRATDGVDATSLAALLLELNDRTMERVVRGGLLDRDQLAAALSEIWLRSVWGDDA